MFQNKKARVLETISEELLVSYGKVISVIGNSSVSDAFDRVVKQADRAIKTKEPSDVSLFLDLMGRLDANLSKMVSDRMAKVLSDKTREIESEEEDGKGKKKEIGFKKETEKC